ncbi:hypothetical protein [Geomicrobium sp. JCM 19039]|uniref:hypothetical protein n=1 Tax=Geomicrobium sp. JCM 19039 TaxID=1460636 RepID=UPI00045F32E6|nr:hypothetical protein [Geomicrobium sp. JCM 19039]GAK12686.1 hypothetical protein JCM19039_2479 [Geomicrobium sp. JCM 19039]
MEIACPKCKSTNIRTFSKKRNVLSMLALSVVGIILGFIIHDILLFIGIAWLLASPLMVLLKDTINAKIAVSNSRKNLHELA